MNFVTGEIEPWEHEQSVRQMLLFSPPPLQKTTARLESFRYPILSQQFHYVSDLRWNIALVGDRYMVGHHSGKLRYVDLQDGRMRRKEFDSPGGGGWLYPIPGRQSFVCTHAAKLPKTAQSSTPVSRVDLIRINDAGDFEFIANWTTTWQTGNGCGIVGNQITNLNKAGTEIKFRDADEGRLSERLKLPASFQSGKQTDFFHDGLFMDRLSAEETLYIDLKSKKRLAAPPSPFLIANRGYRSGTPLLKYVHQNHTQGLLVDADSGGQVMAYTFRKHVPVVLDKFRLLFASLAYGFSAEIVEIPTGKHLQCQFPLWWVPWLL